MFHEIEPVEEEQMKSRYIRVLFLYKLDIYEGKAGRVVCICTWRGAGGRSLGPRRRSFMNQMQIRSYIYTESAQVFFFLNKSYYIWRTDKIVILCFKAGGKKKKKKL